ncbi:WD40 repeat domain-containing protein [Frigoriglobus tundricola]|uniref:WD40 repeat domain-containing protein n=1 Tax=Frigoriglobus tundricola TaxID=2774151 RepID=UPI001D091FFE|nr:WD40 repeat domain-containing protein [Frigoriglobus tundricola]
MSAAQEPPSRSNTPQGQTKDPPLVGPAQANGLPAGAIARLGHTRLRHADKPTCVAFAPDGKTFVTGGDDGTVRVWSVATGEQVHLIQKPGLGVTALQFTHGGKRLAVQFGTDGLIRFFDANTFRDLGSAPFVNRHLFDFSADGTYMATTDLAGNLTVTELANDLPKLELADAKRFAFHPDGKSIAVADTKGTITVYLLTGGKPTFTTKREGEVTGLAYSPNGTRLAVGTRTADGTGRIHLIEGRKENPVAVVAGVNLPKSWVGPDALACGTGTDAGVYDFSKKEWLSRIKNVSGEFAVSPDGTKLVATGDGLRVRLWALTSGKTLHTENDSVPEPALLAGSADGCTLFMLSADTAYHWPTNKEPVKPAGTLPGRAVAAAVGGGRLVVATPDAIVVYDEFDPTRPLPPSPTRTLKDSAGAKAVAASERGNRIAWSQDGGRVVITDATGTGARRELPVTTTSVFALAFNPAGDRLGVLGRDPFLRVWDVSAGAGEPKEVWKARIQRGQKGAVAFSPDGKLVTAVSTAQLAVFDAADGMKSDEYREPLYRAERSSEHGAIHHAAFSPDSRLLVVGSAGVYGRVEVWELVTHGMVRALTTGYGGTARLCVFPDGTRAASAGAEEAITVWDLTLRPSTQPKDTDLRAAWTALLSQDAATGYPAIKVFVAAGTRGAGFLADTLKPLLADERKIKEWVADLGSETFSVRENASKELVAQGSRALAVLSAAVKSDDPEVRDRAREVLGKLTVKGFSVPPHGLIDDQLRLFRVVQALEEIGSVEAKRVVETIAATGGRPGEEAKTVLARWKMKK